MGAEHHIKIQKTGRFHTHGNLKEQKEIWLAFHGYGQLTEYFIKHFEVLDPDKYFVIAPEGFSKFYLKNFTGRIGASWMTKESRDYEIEDYCHFFDEILRHFEIDENTTINIFGFSQGVATATRWIMKGKHKIGKCVFWAGNVASEVLEEKHHRIKGLDITTVLGNNDAILKDFNFDAAAYRDKLNKLLDTPMKSVRFEGGHEINPDTFKEIFNIK